MRTFSRLPLGVALLASFTLLGSDALAIDNGACCVQSTSRLETLMNPNKGSDEKFFTSAGGPPNVMFILDTSCSMAGWPEDWPSDKGCTHPTFAGGGYDPGTDYRGFISGMSGTTGAKQPTFDAKWFNNDVIYRANGNSGFGTSAFGHNFSSGGGPSGTQWNSGSYTASRDAACSSITGAVAADITTCKGCLDTKGYYVQNSSTRIASGNFLKYYSPRDVSAVMVLSHLLFDIREVRLGIMTFDNWGGSSCLAPGNGNGPTCLWQPLGPNCDKIYPFDTSSVENNRNSILNALAGNNSFSSHTPLATNLYMAGWHLRASATTPDGYDNLFANNYPGNGTSCSGCNFNNLNEPNTANARSICTGCSFNAAIILTDGEPRDELITSWPAEITSLTAQTNPYCPSGSGECNSYLDEIAAFLYNNDLRPELPGKQKIATYTIGFGTSGNANQLLASAAKVGGGKFYPALGAAAINDAIMQIFDDIAARNNSFSSSAVASVQTGSSSTPALLPRMLPKAGQPWEGKLWRFEQYNEFVETTGSAIADLNGDGDNEDVFIIDKDGPTLANIVTETADGTFVKNGTATPAKEFWEGNDKLVKDLTTNGLASRRVWTVLDTNGDGAFTHADALSRFKPTDDAFDLKMAEYMGLVGASSVCPSGDGAGALLSKFGMSIGQAGTAVGALLPGTPTEADYARLCARVVMRWVMGADLYDVDADGNRTEPRPNVMGDIFHASPVIVEAPVDTFLCELGLSNQCVRTLYSQQLGVAATPLTNEVTTLAGPTGCDNSSKTAYEAYVWDQRARDKVVLVGANDGLVHAFLSGRKTGETCVGGQPVPTFDRGDGTELWAFLPPDLLPKLPDLILSHEYMVDGDIMVRDVWADGTNPGTKEKSEYHTLAVVSEGRGGKHYFALEMRYQSNGQAEDRPGFRWMFPQPCSEESALFGKTLFALSPKPPPIGPMLINNSDLPTPIANPITRYTVPTHERWMVAVSGGWSPGQEKGRGVYLLDAWNGAINGRRDNLWWKFEYDEEGSGADGAPKKELTNSVAAPIALVDYGPDDAPGQDGFFDTAVFSDTAGQIWVARMQTPGTINDDGKRNMIDNWFAARAFEMDRDGVPGAAIDTLLADGGVDVADVNAKSVSNKWPFYYLPSVAVEPGTDRLRVFAGTGNRYAILETGPGMCRFDNPLACAKARCDDTNVTSRYKDGVTTVDHAHTHWKNRRFEHGKEDETFSKYAVDTLVSGDMCGTAGGKRVETENENFKVGKCDVTTGADPTPGKVNEVKYECGLNASGSSFSCTRKSLDRNLNDLLDPSTIDTAGLGNNRFVGLWAYGGRQADAGYRGFAGSSGVTPQNYDKARVSDRSSTNAGSGELYDVTNVGCTADGKCDGGAPEDGYGWFYTYSDLARKTATGGAVIASCVLWSDLSPSGGDGGLCGSSITPSSSIYQGDFLTGQPNCAYGFLPQDGGAYARSQTRTVVAPPPEPASVVQVSKSGQVRYSAMIVEPGRGQATTVNVSGGQDVLQLIYELPVSRSLHNCRHADAGCNTVP